MKSLFRKKQRSPADAMAKTVLATVGAALVVGTSMLATAVTGAIMAAGAVSGTAVSIAAAAGGFIAGAVAGVPIGAAVLVTGAMAYGALKLGLKGTARLIDATAAAIIKRKAQKKLKKIAQAVNTPQKAVEAAPAEKTVKTAKKGFDKAKAPQAKKAKAAPKAKATAKQPKKAKGQTA